MSINLRQKYFSKILTKLVVVYLLFIILFLELKKAGKAADFLSFIMHIFLEKEIRK